MVKDPTSRDVWCAYATACYLAGDYATCVSIVESMFRFDKEDTKKPMSVL